MDGLRMDATDAILDDSPEHILAELSRRVRAVTERDIVLIAEEARNDVRTVRSAAEGGHGIDAVWADDFHHELQVYLTGAHENYYADYTGRLEDLATAINEGFLYQGQISPSTGKPRGTRVTGEPATAFLFCLQNHDQIGNRPLGDRLNHQIDLARYAVASALLLFVAEPPLLFMGQEFAASSPFLYFTDHEEELGRLVTEGRRHEFSGFSAFHDPAQQAAIPDPQAESTFRASKLNLDERQVNAGIYALYRDLLSLRAGDPVLSVADRTAMRAEAIGPDTLMVRRWQDGKQRLLIANFGEEFRLRLSDIPAGDWRPVLSTADGESSAEMSIADHAIDIPAHSAVILASG
jgi:maltooligosyltrehalose trehalohydrolase